MKKIALLAAAFAACTVSRAYSAPLYFTFTGTVTLIPSDQGGYAAARGYHAGTPLTYVFVVDTAKNGYVTSGGVATENEDINNTGHTQNYFYDSLVYPGAFTSALSGHDNESIFGYRTTTTGTAATRYSLAFQVILGTYHVYDQIVLNIPDSGRVDFLPPVGTKVTGAEIFADTSGKGSTLSVSMTLTSIDATMPAIAIRAPAMAAPAWMDAKRKDGGLFLENLSGQTAVVAVLDVSGKTLASVTLDDRAMIPASALPQGRLFLAVTRIGRGESSRQVFNL